jgi:uncharacterized protein (UPF0332 family)
VSSFPWADFLQLAEDLATQADTEQSEAKRRTAVGRAYYATYNAARDYAQSKGLDVSTKESSAHGKLWNELAFQPGKAPKLANHGRQLLTLRKHADYDATRPLTSAQLNSSLAIARNARQLLQEFISGDGGKGA